MRIIRAILLVIKILRWHEKHFKDWTFEQQADKWKQELGELLMAWKKHNEQPKNQTRLRHVYEEMADVLIAGLSLLKYYEGYSTVKLKLDVIKQRRYGKDGQHIEERNRTNKA